MADRVCFIHVGTGKTGSTAIQMALTKGRAYLSSKGVDYPDLSGNLALASQLRATAGNGISVFKALQRGDMRSAVGIVQDGADLGRSFILSCEGMWQLPADTLVTFVASIRDLGFVAKGLAYFRPQADFWVSSYLQQIKSGKLDWRLDVEDFVQGCIRRLTAERGRGNWLATADGLARAFGTERFTVHWYPSLASKGHDQIVRSFFAWIGVPPLEAGGDAAVVNPSPNPEALMVLRMMNAGGIGGRAFAERFLQLAQDAQLLDKRQMLPRADIELIDRLTGTDNEELLRRYARDHSPEEARRVQTVPEAGRPILRKAVVAKLLNLAAQVLAGEGQDG